MKTLQGNLIELAKAGAFDVIVHGCNCFCTMAKGLALAVRSELPAAFQVDQMTVKGDRGKLGTFSRADIPLESTQLVVLNGYTQYDWRGHGVRADYEAIRRVFRAIKASFSGLRIGYPKIGAGEARGDWELIAQIIEEELAGEDHTLVLFPAPAVELPAASPGLLLAQPRIYAGIGSRNTPVDVLGYMRRVAVRLAARGWVLRSGAAAGADSAFEAGCDDAHGAKKIWLPWAGFNDHGTPAALPTAEHMALAAQLHPAWAGLGQAARKLHARNVGQVLGPQLDAPVRFILCWTPDGCETEQARSSKTGGTATAIVLASQRGIPVFNLKNEHARDRLASMVLG